MIFASIRRRKKFVKMITKFLKEYPLYYPMEEALSMWANANNFLDYADKYLSKECRKRGLTESEITEFWQAVDEGWYRHWGSDKRWIVFFEINGKLDSCEVYATVKEANHYARYNWKLNASYYSRIYVGIANASPLDDLESEDGTGLYDWNLVGEITMNETCFDSKKINRVYFK